MTSNTQPAIEEDIVGAIDSNNEADLNDEVDSNHEADSDNGVDAAAEVPEAAAESAFDNTPVAVTAPVDAALLQRIVEGALLAAGKPLSVAELVDLFDLHERPEADEVRAALESIAAHYAGRGFELREVASGFRFQVVQETAPWIARLWEEKPQKYSRALLETLALIAYRQPITRGDIEDIRGVAVATNIIKTLLERDWIRVVGHKDVPGRPAMYATTRKFLDYFNLKNLDDLPPLAEIRDLDSFNTELALEGADTVMVDDQAAAAEETAASVAEEVVAAADGSASAVDELESTVGAAESAAAEDNESTAADDDESAPDSDAAERES